MAEGLLPARSQAARGRPTQRCTRRPQGFSQRFSNDALPFVPMCTYSAVVTGRKDRPANGASATAPELVSGS